MLTKYMIKKTSYDANHDLLYITFTTDRSQSYGEQEEDGIEVMRDMETEEITGLMVFDACDENKIRQKSLQNLGFDINVSNMLECSLSV